MSLEHKTSRGPSVDVEQCNRNAGGQYEAILIVAARARELRRRIHKEDIYTNRQSVVTALLELQADKLDPQEYLQKSVQQHTRADSENSRRYRRRSK